MSERAYGRLLDKCEKLEADNARLRTEFKRFLDICGEGSARGRAIDLIDKCDFARARRALENKP